MLFRSTPMVYKTLFEEMDFRVLDVCCKEHVQEVLNDHPLKPGILPQSIVYMIDLTQSEEELKKSRMEFQNWMAYLTKVYGKRNFEKTPVSILYNKLDLNPEANLEEFKAQFYIDHPLLKQQAISVKKNIGLEQSFKWIVQNIKVATKF